MDDAVIIDVIGLIGPLDEPEDIEELINDAVNHWQASTPVYPSSPHDMGLAG